MVTGKWTHLCEKQNIVRGHFIDFFCLNQLFGFTPDLWTIPETDAEMHRQALSGERV